MYVAFCRRPPTWHYTGVSDDRKQWRVTWRQSDVSEETMEVVVNAVVRTRVAEPLNQATALKSETTNAKHRRLS